MGTADLSIKEKQCAYHDWEARRYDAKFSISYDERCITYARERFLKAIPDGGRFERVLEVGTGTGFFVVNLWQAGLLGEDVHVIDISAGMLEVCQRNAREHGLELHARQADAEALPYEDGRFDLVIGHAVLHHLPDPATALREMYRVLAPGGRLVIAGEPSRWGDRILRRIKRGTYLGFMGLTALPPLRSLRQGPDPWERDPDPEANGDVELAALEWEVDLHTFAPADVEAMARDAGFVDVRAVTEDLTASWLGWAVRTVEGSSRPGALGSRWARFAYRSYLRLQRLDSAVLARVVPRGLFYNVILHARRPA
ncbi:MAG TPA: class I SAM-dependent methyltransferase [Nitriliruptorales bacterium]|nr:class I SAM-dependent methyltransferase [Nitriliruptorales bacterium]